MGGRRINPHALTRTGSELIDQSRRSIDSLRAMRAPIDTVINEGRLTGAAWSGLKSQVSNYQAIIRSLIMAYGCLFG